MFDKLKQLKQIKELQDSLSKERKEVEKEGVKVTVNGKMEIEEIVLNPDLDAKKQAEIVKECLNDAMKQVQMAAAQKMFNMQ